MRPRETDHTAAVDSWLHGAASLSTPELLAFFEQAVGALWRRAQRPLGEVTLSAIADRVLHTARERYPVLEPLTVERDAIRFEALRAGSDRLQAKALLEAMRFVVVELLTVLGSLTAQVLTPALHSELLTVKPGAFAEEDAGVSPGGKSGPEEADS
jgi:hypothetical protein